MNHREGKFGTQEAASITTIAVVISGIFSVDNSSTYKNGNMLYLASTIALVLAGLIFLLLVRAMNKQGASTLVELASRPFGVLISPLIIVALLIFAVFPLFRFLQIMIRFIFVEAEYIDIALYFLIAMVLVSSLGMEIIARSARVIVVIFLLAIAIALVIASPVYSAYHLYPLFSLGADEFMLQVASSTLRFLAPLIALLVINRGAHGTKSTKRAGLIALISGGVLTILSQLSLGLTHFHSNLADMSAPFYRLTMEVRYEAPALRTDKTLLFIWTVGAMLVAAYYVYCASLLLVRTYKVGDVRPVCAIFSCITICAMLLMHFDSAMIDSVVSWLYQWGWVILAAPLVVLCFIGNVKRRKLA
ncbi:MAG: GerAB/ArcD/ProY family transporter [Eubacteriales bacterium]|nr:GerAB/ArcD/ProY family transporter [Eubacteriales bacterium]